MTRSSYHETARVPITAILGLVLDQNAPAEVLERLSEVARVHRCTEEAVGAKDQALRVVISFLIRHPNATPRVLSVFFDDSDESVAHACRSSPLIPEDMFRMIFSQGGVDADLMCANPRLSGLELRQLAIGANTLRVASIAWNPNTPKDMLMRLARNRSVGVRCMAARNPETPAECLNALALDKSAMVRANVAINPAASDALLHDLETDAVESVRATAGIFTEARAFRREHPPGGWGA